MRRRRYNGAVVGVVCAGLIGLVAHAQNLERQSFLPVVITEDFATIMQRDMAAKSEVMQRQRALLEERYDLSDRPAARVMMSGGRKPVQEGVRVKLPGQMSGDQLTATSPTEIRHRALMPPGILPLPQVKHEVRGEVFPKFHIDELQRQEGRSLERFEEILGQEIFFGKGQCGVCHPALFYLDDKMHDLKVERFYKPRMINDQWIHADGPIQTFTLRGIKESPPYLHGGRLLTPDDTVECFNLVLGLQLDQQEKPWLVAFMRQL